MRKVLKSGLSLAFLTIGFFTFASRAPLLSSPVEASAENFADSTSATPAAKKLYQANCARCHGADGRGETEAGKQYDVPLIAGKSNRRRVESVIKNGADSMPAFGKKLSKAQITSLAEYVRTL